MTGGPILRPAARVLLLDPDGRTFLFQWRDDATGFTWWATPGGGIDAGETPEAAARRELLEETGLREVELGPCIWLRETRFDFGGRSYVQPERIYVARVDPFDPALDGLNRVESAMLRDMRWWTAAEIAAAPDVFAPRRLASLLADLLERGYPTAPIHLDT